tara:strand:- start:587 stop:928 length:342 start_codon:yes stop_codon:yes gene_type:complete
MTEQIGTYKTSTQNSMTNAVDITAFSAGAEMGYQLTFVIDSQKQKEHQDSFRPMIKHTCAEDAENMMNLAWFSLSGSQIEDLYRMHLERKTDGLEQMSRVANPKTIGWTGEEL